MDRSSENFGLNARSQRKALGITLRDVAAAIGRTYVHISNIERGHTPGSPEDRRRILAYLRERAKPDPILRAARRSRQQAGTEHDAR